MKKLMIAAAIVCAAALTQAANVTWSISNVADSSKNVEGDYAVYFLMASDDSGAAASKLWSVADATAAANSKNADAFAAHTIPAAKTVSYDDGELRAVSSAKVTSYASSWVSPDAEGNDQYGSFYAVIFNADDIADATQYMVVGPESLKFGTQTVNSTVKLNAQTSSWNDIQSVPEPTSGLLLLLGVAGLALRRRRA